MADQKVSTLIYQQVPEYVREEFPLVAEFLKQYYISQEFQSASADIVQNIDQYIKLDVIENNNDSTELIEDVSFIDDEIFVNSNSLKTLILLITLNHYYNVSTYLVNNEVLCFTCVFLFSILLLNPINRLILHSTNINDNVITRFFKWFLLY